MMILSSWGTIAFSCSFPTHQSLTQTVSHDEAKESNNADLRLVVLSGASFTILGRSLLEFWRDPIRAVARQLHLQLCVGTSFSEAESYLWC
jgi:hypothetical protein